MNTSKKVIGVILALVSVLTLFFGWVSASSFVKNTLKAADSMLSLIDSNWSTARDALLDGTLEDLTDGILTMADSLGMPTDDIAIISNSLSKIFSRIKDLSVSPRDVTVISSNLGKIVKVAASYSDNLDPEVLHTMATIRTTLTLSNLLVWLIMLLGVIVVVTRVLGCSGGWDIAYFISMILLTAVFVIASLSINKAAKGQALFDYFTIEQNILQLTIWPFIGILCALPMWLLPGPKSSKKSRAGYRRSCSASSRRRR